MAISTALIMGGFSRCVCVPHQKRIYKLQGCCAGTSTFSVVPFASDVRASMSGNKINPSISYFQKNGYHIFFLSDDVNWAIIICYASYLLNHGPSSAFAFMDR